MRGISVEFFKSEMQGDCTNGGYSSNDYRGYIFDEKLNDGNFSLEEMGDNDYLVVVDGPYNTKRAVPKSLIDSGKHYMFGGNFVYTSDSRFARLNNGNPIKIFDRVE